MTAISAVATHLPILQVMVPLIAAPACFVLRSGRLAWGFATLVSWAAFAMSLLLLQAVMSGGTIHYEIGGWDAPRGIPSVFAAPNAVVLVLDQVVSEACRARGMQSESTSVGAG